MAQAVPASGPRSASFSRSSSSRMTVAHIPSPAGPCNGRASGRSFASLSSSNPIEPTRLALPHACLKRSHVLSRCRLRAPRSGSRRAPARTAKPALRGEAAASRSVSAAVACSGKFITARRFHSGVACSGQPNADAILPRPLEARHRRLRPAPEPGRSHDAAPSSSRASHGGRPIRRARLRPHAVERAQHPALHRSRTSGWRRRVASSGAKPACLAKLKYTSPEQ